MGTLDTILTAQVLPWAASTFYQAGAPVTQGGYFWTAQSSHTSGATFSGAYPTGNWIQGAQTIGATGPAQASDISSITISTDYTLTTSLATVTGASITVPANSGAAVVEIVGGVPWSVNSGTNSATTTQGLTFQIVDELSNVLVASGDVFYGTGTTLNYQRVMPIAVAVASNTVDKTYSLQARYNRAGTLSATGTLPFSSQSRIMRALHR